MTFINRHIKIFVTFITIVVGVLSVYAFSAHAAFNRQINYQGKLTNASNVAVTDGGYNMRFKLYTTPTGNPGTEIWTETWCYSPDSGASCTGAGTNNRVNITNGLFSVMLGSTTPLTGIDFNQTLYLGVEIGGTGSSFSGDGEMLPRKRFGAVPAAFVADTLQGLSSSQFFRTDAQNATSSVSTFLNIVQTGAGKIAELFGANSASVFTALSNGNVGVGTSTPYATFSVNGQIVAGYLTATTSTASTFPYASSTALTVSGTASSSNVIASNSLKIGGITGNLQAINGLVSASTSLSTIYGGTEITNPTAGGILVGTYAGGKWQQLSTSTLGLLTTNVAEGSNLYYLDSRVQSFIHASTTIPKTYTANTFTAGQTFSSGATTTAFAITSIPSALLKTNSSGSIIGAIAGVDYLTAANIFAYLFPGNATTTLLAFNGGLTSYASTTIGAGGQGTGLTVNGGATTTGNLYVAGNTTLNTALNGPLQAVNGLVSASSTLSINYGGTGLSTKPAYGQLLLGQANGSYALTSTSSLGLLQAGLITIVHSDGTKAVYNATTSSDVGRGVTLMTALSAAVTGDSLYLASTTYDIQDGYLDLSKNGTASISLHGAGKYQTIIQSRIPSSTFKYIVMPGSLSEVTDLSIIGNAADNVYQVPYGVLNISYPIVAAVLRNVYLQAESDGIYISITSGKAMFYAHNLTVRSMFDGIVFVPATSDSEFNLYDSDISSVATLAINSGENANAVTADTGIVNVYNSILTATGTVVAGSSNAVYSTGTAVITINGGKITSGSAGSDYWDLHASGSAIRVTANTVYDPTRVSGSVTYVDNSQLRYSLGSSGSNGTVLWNNNGVASWLATSSLGIAFSNLVGTLGVSQGGTGATSFGQGWIYSNGSTGALAASTSPTVAYVTATSTTAASRFPLLTTTNATSSTFAITSIPSALLKTNSSGSIIGAIAGVDYLTAANIFAYLFPGNATTTLLAFNGGLTSYASTTIGNGAQAGGLTINGGATTTGNLYVAGNENVAGNFQIGGNSTRLLVTNFMTPYSVSIGDPDANGYGNTIHTSDSAGVMQVYGSSGIALNGGSGGVSITGLNGLMAYASSTIGDGTQAGGLTINGGATTTGNLYVRGNTTLNTALNGVLQAINGLVSASSTLSINYGGTGLSTKPAYGQLLLGQANGSYALTATSSLGLLTTNVAEGSNLYYLDSRVQSFIHASTTIPKTYTANTFTGAQTFNGAVNATAGLTTNTLTVGSLTGNLQAINGVVSASSSLATIYGGTEITNPTAAGILLGSYAGGKWQQLATSSLGITFTNLVGTLGVSQGGTGATSFGQGWIYSNGATGALNSSTSPTVAYITATSTTATSTFAGGANLAVNAGNVGVGTANPTFLTDINGTLGIGKITDTTTQGEVLRLRAGSSGGATSYMTFQRVSGTNASYGIGYFSSSGWGMQQIGDAVNFFNVNSFGTANSTKIISIGSSNGQVSASTTIYGNIGGPSTLLSLGTMNSSVGANPKQSFISLSQVAGNTGELAAIAGIKYSSLTTTNVTGGLAFYTANDTLTGATERMRLDNIGNLGIGTTTPWRTLSVNGSSDLGNNALAGYFTATTTTASIFPYASTTALSATSFCLSTDCRSTWASVGSAYPFGLAGNATSTRTQFNGGLTSYASTTIGNGAQVGGLTISGGATTTGNAYFGSAVNITGTNNLNFGNANSAFSRIYSPTGNGGLTLEATNGENLTLTADIVSIVAGLDLSGAALASNLIADSDNSFNIGSLTQRFSNLYLGNNAYIYGNARASYFTATSTSIASTFPYASSTMITVGSVGSGTNIKEGKVYSPDALEVTGGSYLSFGGPSTLNYATEFETAVGFMSSTGFEGNVIFNSAVNGSSANWSGQLGTGTSSPYGQLAVSSASQSGLMPLLNVASSTNASLFSVLGNGNVNVAGKLTAAYASTTALSATSLCISTDCRTAWPSVSGGGVGWATSTANSQSVYFYGTSNVGIGSSTPFYKLSVEGTGSFGNQVIANTFNATSTTATSTFSGGVNLAVSGGNVGVGTSNPQYAQLDIVGSAFPKTLLGFRRSGAGDWGISLGSETISNLYIGCISTAGCTATSDYFWKANWNTAGAAGNTFQVAATSDNALTAVEILQKRAGNTGDYLHITSNGATTGNILNVSNAGNVGIGTTSPYAKLSVDGRGVFNQDIRANYYTATSTSVASVFPLLTTTNATSSTLAITSIPSALLKTNSSGSVIGAVAGVDYLTAANIFAYLFPSNATTTLLAFNGGLTSYASTTIGNGSATGGLTVNGNSTTTGNVYVAGTMGVGTTTPSDKLDVFGGNIRVSSSTTALSNYTQYKDKEIFWFASGGFSSRLNFGNTRMTLYDSSGVPEVNIGGGTTGSAGSVVQANVFESSNLGGSQYNPLTMRSNYFGISATTPAIDFQVFRTSGANNQLSRLQIFNGDNGNIVMQSNSLGYVGLGTSTPFARLSVAGGSGDTSPVFAISTSTGAYATTTALLIDKNGNLSLLNGASASVAGRLTVGSLTGPLQAINGLVSASSTLSSAYGGTGASSFGQGWIYSNGGTSALAASTSPTVAYITATSTTGINAFGGKMTIGSTPSTGVLTVGTSNTDSTLSNAASSLVLENSNAGAGQTLLTFSFGGTPLGGVRGDFAGNFNWHATGGQGHQFYNSLDTTNIVAGIGGNGIIIKGAAGSTPTNTLDVLGNAIIGAGYDSIGAPENGLLVQGFVGIGTNAPSAQLNVVGAVEADVTGTTGFHVAGDDGTSITISNGVGVDLGTSNSFAVTSFEAGSFFVNLGAGSDDTQGGPIILTAGAGGNDGGSGGGIGGDISLTAGGGSSAGTNRGGNVTLQVGLGQGGAKNGYLLLNPSYGFVGIGTSTPGRTFSVAGSSDLGNSASAGYFTATTTTASSFPYASTTALSATSLCLSTDCRTSWPTGGSGGGGVGWATSTANSQSAYFYGTGNVGIGSSTPWGKLSITQTGTTPAFVVEDASSPDTTPFIIDASGQVGIGTAIPAKTLDVVGTLRTSGIASLSEIDLGSGWAKWNQGAAGGIGLGSGHNIAWTTTTTNTGNSGDVGLSRISAGVLGVGNGTAGNASSTLIVGRMGIGTTSPYTALAVVGQVLADYFTATSTTATSTLAGYLDVNGTNGTSTIASNLWVKGTLRTGTGSMYLNDTAIISSNGNLALTNNGNSYLKGGNFGVGTSTPTALLQIQSNTTSGIVFDIRSNSSQLSSLFTLGEDGPNNGDFAIKNSNSTKIKLTGNNTSFVNNGANFGFGTTTPWAKLSVQAEDNAGYPMFLVSSSTKPVFMVANNGQIRIGTTSPSLDCLDCTVVVAPSQVLSNSTTANLRVDGPLYAKLSLKSDTAPVDARKIQIYQGNGGNFHIGALSDSEGVEDTILDVTRTGSVVNLLTFGGVNESHSATIFANSGLQSEDHNFTAASTNVFTSPLWVSTGTDLGANPDFNILSFGDDVGSNVNGLPFSLRWYGSISAFGVDDGAGNPQTIYSNCFYNGSTCLGGSSGGAGYVQLSNGAGAFSASSGLNYTSSRLGVGSSTPVATLSVKANSGDHDAFQVTKSNDTPIFSVENSGNIFLDGSAGNSGALPNSRYLAIGRSDGSWGNHGLNLFLQAGGAKSGITNAAGGKLILASGTTTGNAASYMEFWTVPQDTGSSGSTDNAPIKQMSLNNRGALCLGTDACNGANGEQFGGMDIAYGGGPTTLTLGADLNAETRTNYTNKYATVGAAPYLTTARPVGFFASNSAATSNTVSVGGGSSSFQAATSLGFYTAQATSTFTGLERLTINNIGNVGINQTSPVHILDIHLPTDATAKTAAFAGVQVSNTATSSTASINKSGVEIISTGTWNGTNANNIGLYVSSVTGGTNNYDAVFNGGGAVTIGVATTTSTNKFAVTGQSATTTSTFSQFSTDVTAPLIQFAKYRGTVNAQTPTVAGDYLGAVHFSGYTGSGLFPGAQIYSKASIVQAGAVYSNLVFATRDTGDAAMHDRLTFDNGGNITAVGTLGASNMTLSTSDAGLVFGDAVTAALTIKNTSSVLNNFAGIKFQNQVTGTAGFIGTQHMDNAGSTGSDLVFGVKGTQNATTPLEFMRLKQLTGNLGISSTTPWGRLSVTSTSTTDLSPIFVAGHSAAGAGTTTDFIIQGNAGNVGYVGIGTTTPWRMLSVGGTVAMSGLTGNFGAGSLCLTASKEVVFNSGSDACTSSVRATKHDISALSLNGLAAIKDLTPVSFIYNEGDGRTRYGFIAEDAALVNDNFATHNENGDLTGIDDRALIATIVKGVQEQQGQIGALATSTLNLTTSNVALSTSIADNTSNLEALTTNLASTSQSTRSLARALDATNDTVSELSNRIRELTATTSSIIAMFDDRINALSQNNLSSLTSSSTFMAALASATAAQVASSTADILASSTPSFIARVASAVKESIETVGDWTVNKMTAHVVYTDRIEAQTVAVSKGLEINDVATGQVFCIQVRNGEWDKRPGACTDQPVTAQSPVPANNPPVAQNQGDTPGTVVTGSPVSGDSASTTSATTSTPADATSSGTSGTTATPTTSDTTSSSGTNDNSVNIGSVSVSAPAPQQAPVSAPAPEPSPAPAPAPEPAPAPAPSADAPTS